MSSLQESLARAYWYYQAGDLLGAELAYRQILEADPSNADVWCVLGVISRAQGKLPEAVDCYRQALAIRPVFPEAHNNLGNVFFTQGNFNEALPCYQQALQARPDYVETYCNQGIALRQLGRLDEALASLQQAVRLRPGYPEAHSALASVLAGLGKLDVALAHGREAVRLRPAFAEAYDNLGVVLLKLGHIDEALTHHQESIRLQPTAEAYVNQGAAFAARKNLDQAIASYRQALQLNPSMPTAHYNLGVALTDQGHWELAVASLREALRLHPAYADALDRLAYALMLQGKPAEAAKQYREALRLRPHDAQVHSNLLLCLNYLPDLTPDELWAEHRQWDSAHGQVTRLGPLPGHDRAPDRRLRVGYVSADFRKHPVASFIEPILANHDPAQVEAIVYAHVAVPDAVTDRLRALAHGWRVTHGSNFAQIAEQIRKDRIDILIDLAGHAGSSLLPVFAHKPAPVQVTYLGYPNTTGLAALDYRLTDAIADPPGEPVHHAEALVRLDQSFCCWAPPADAPAVSPPPVQRTGNFTFGSVHNLAKLNAGVFERCSAILREVPSARLLICRDNLSPERQDELRRSFTDRGVTPGQVAFATAADFGKDYLTIYREIDLFLDAAPFGGHTTVCEALWMGVPVLTLRGDRFASRVASSVLSCVGLTEFSAPTSEAYVALAVDCARHPERLAALRASLREQLRSSPLCDGKRFTRGLEAALRTMWERWVGSAREP